MEIRQKMLTLSSRLVRSLKVVGTDTDRSAAYDFLVFRSNDEPLSYCFRDKRGFMSKIAIFSHPHIFNAVAEGVPLGIL